MRGEKAEASTQAELTPDVAGAGTDHDGPDGLPAGPPDSGADDAVQALFVVPVCNGPGPCRAFVRPLPRAPPLA